MKNKDILLLGLIFSLKVISFMLLIIFGVLVFIEPKYYPILVFIFIAWCIAYRLKPLDELVKGMIK